VEFAQARVDGDVPAFWTESGDEMTAGLVFRAGSADEQLARRGITHLIEHLALYPLGPGIGVHYNGQVDALTTTFLTRRNPGEVADFFKAVCASLRELPMGRLEAEKQVLRTESDQRRPVISEPLFIERYGADTYGLIAYPEFGIGAFQADEVRAWARKYFTRDNAAMWIAGGPPPSELRLDLPDGPAIRAPKPTRSESEAYNSSLFVLPPKREPFRAGFTDLGLPSDRAVTGRRIRSADYPLDRRRLVIGEDGVSLEQGQAVDTVRYAECAALLEWSDGGLRLIGRDGVSIRIRIEPTLWRLKNHAAHLAEKVGPSRLVSMPYRPSETVPRPWSRRPARIAGRMLVEPWAAFLTGTVPVAALFLVVVLIAPGAVGFGAAILLAPMVLLGIAQPRLARVRLLKRAAKRMAQRT
jgi:hypothetical protein